MKKNIFLGLGLLLFAATAFAQHDEDSNKDIRVMPFSQYVDMPARPLPKKEKYPYTQEFFTYTLWDSLKTTLTLNAQQQWGDYSFIWQTENGICKIGDQEFGPNNDRYGEGAYLYSSDSVSYFYSTPLKKYYQSLLQELNAPAPLPMPTGFFEDIKRYNQDKRMADIENIAPVKMWARQFGAFDTVLVATGNFDADADLERIVTFRVRKVDSKGYRTYRLLVCNKGEDRRWYAHSAIEVTNLEKIDFDAKHQAIIIQRELGRGGTGQSFQDRWQDIYKWQDGKLGKPLGVYSERTHDTDQDSPYYFDRDRRAHFRWSDENTVEITDSTRLYGSVWAEEERVDKSSYIWQPEAMEFAETQSTAWERPPPPNRLDTVQFQLYTRWDSIPATAVRRWKINPLSRKFKFARSMDMASYMVDGKQYDYEQGQCSSFAYNPPHHYDDITTYSCELQRKINEWNEPINAPAVIPISNELFFYVNIAKNADTLMSLAPLKHWYYLIADADRPEIDQNKHMEIWQVNLDEDPENETIWFITDGTHINGLMLIVDNLGGKQYITSAVDIPWFNRLPTPKVDAKNKLIIVTCPKGRFEDVQFYRYAGGQLKKVLDLQGGVEIGGLRQELQMAYLPKSENQIEVYYTYNLFFEKSYPENEAMKLGFLNNKEAKVTFEYNGTEFTQTAATPAIPATRNQKNAAVMGAFLHFYQPELEEQKDKGEVSQRELLSTYLNEYLRKFVIE